MKGEAHERGKTGQDHGTAMKEGWMIKLLGEVCEFQRGLTYAKSDEVDVSDNVVLRATNINLATNLLIFDELKYISDKVVVPKSKKVKQGSLMICMASGSKSHLGKVALIEDDYGYAFGGFMGMLTPLNGLLPKFLFHLMTSENYKDFIGALSDGANINNLTFDKLKVFPIPVPPLPEQQRIVAILDEAFAGIATAKANAEKNLQNARAIFDSHLNEVFIQGGLGWVEKKLSEAFDIGSSKRILETEWTSVGVPFYGGKEIVKLAKYGSVNSNAFISEKKYREYAAKYDMPRRDDILITARGTIGVGYVVQDGDVFYYKDGNIISMRAKMPTNPHFVLYAFRSKAIIQQFDDLAGTTVRHLPIEKAKGLVLKFPDFGIQNKAVENIREIECLTQRLTSIYERKLSALEALKKSLLHRAFRGEL